MFHGFRAVFKSGRFSRDVYELPAQPKELLIVKNSNHVDLYDRLDKIPFDRISDFFGKNLK